MVFLTGDTHADFHRFSSDLFSVQKEMTRDDIVIILGDFGGVWQDSKSERWWLKWLSSRPYTTCFIDGNHENFDRLFGSEFRDVEFHGGRAKAIGSNIYYLRRGEIFEFEGKKFFTMGGASSHDIQDGILDPSDFDDIDEFRKTYDLWARQGRMFRVKHLSWWPEELPSYDELSYAERTLRKADMRVDYVLSHCLPTSINALLGYSGCDRLTEWFQALIDSGFSFDSWWSGHLHRNKFFLLGKYNVLYGHIERLL